MARVTSQYALAGLARTAQLPAGSSILGSEVAEKTCIATNYVPETLLFLHSAGLAATARSSGGGKWSVCPCDGIHLLRVVDWLDRRTRPPCILGVDEECIGDQPCSANVARHKIRFSYQQFLERTTLADIAGERGARRTKARAARAGGRQS